MPSIFISYRRADSEAVAGRIYDRLVGHIGRDSLFKDVDSIRGGQVFPDVLAQTLEKCDAVLVLIGNSWLKAKGKNGRRLDDPADFLRLEIETALRRELLVIPLLVGRALMPEAKDLPQSLRGLASRRGLPVRPDPDFHRDMDRVLAALGITTVRAEPSVVKKLPDHIAYKLVRVRIKAFKKAIEKVYGSLNELDIVWDDPVSNLSDYPQYNRCLLNVRTRLVEEAEVEATGFEVVEYDWDHQERVLSLIEAEMKVGAKLKTYGPSYMLKGIWTTKESVPDERGLPACDLFFDYEAIADTSS